jgi:branched-chain amino acid transport system substrate-binding protein
MGASAVLAAAVGGCTAAGTATTTIAGKTLTIYASAPAAATQQSQDVLGAEQLALAQHGGRIGKLTVRLVSLTGKISDNARTAIVDPSTIAYLGEIAPGASAGSAGITNAQDVLQVSPTDTALELTQPSAAVSGAPGRYYESLKTYGKTFARVVPSTAQEAKAQVQEMQSLSVKTLYVADDGSRYGAAIALAVKQEATRAGISIVPRGQEGALFFGGSSDAAALSAFRDAAAGGRAVKLLAPSALDDQALAAGLSGLAAAQLYVSSPGFLPKDLPPAGRKFVSDFQSAYHHAPSPQAIFGYEAMAAVLDVLGQAGASAGDRTKLVHDFFAIRSRSSVLGTYSINANGDTSLAPFVFSHVQAGKLAPFRFVSVQG